MAIKNFVDFFAAQTPNLSVSGVLMSLILAAVLAHILSKLYVKYGTALSNRRKFASNFIILATTTTLIITVVKSSLALSLGLVGALSIVRFRAAIKEPEELAFLFLIIAIGLGFGANQWLITILAFIVISLLIVMRHFKRKKEENQNLYLTVAGKKSKNLSLECIIDVLKKSCDAVHLKRFDELDGVLEASFLVDFDSYTKLQDVKKGLNKLAKDVRITYLDKN